MYSELQISLSLKDSMENDHPDKPPSYSASQAMNTVLKAEQDAERSVAECRKVAHQTIQNAQQHAAQITRRTNERITMLHLRCKQNIAQQISGMERTAASELRNVQGAGLHEDKLTELVEEVAAGLIGLHGTGKSDR
ncbi:MAG: hypothetical protein U9N50_03930 [Pseudomonadota bacterium]|nr:hypothetical protein [Pseudomonadota bacterium]